MEYILSEHAETTIREREIKAEWIETALNSPDLLTPHETDATAKHAFKRISEFNDRVLHVVFNAIENPIVIITVYFDRKMKGLL